MHLKPRAACHEECSLVSFQGDLRKHVKIRDNGATCDLRNVTDWAL